jgi:hypothetical protein
VEVVAYDEDAGELRPFGEVMLRRVGFCGQVHERRTAVSAAWLAGTPRPKARAWASVPGGSIGAPSLPRNFSVRMIRYVLAQSLRLSTLKTVG